MHRTTKPRAKRAAAAAKKRRREVDMLKDALTVTKKKKRDVTEELHVNSRDSDDSEDSYDSEDSDDTKDSDDPKLRRSDREKFQTDFLSEKSQKESEERQTKRKAANEKKRKQRQEQAKRDAEEAEKERQKMTFQDKLHHHEKHRPRGTNPAHRKTFYVTEEQRKQYAQDLYNWAVAHVTEQFPSDQYATTRESIIALVRKIVDDYVQVFMNAKYNDERAQRGEEPVEYDPWEFIYNTVVYGPPGVGKTTVLKFLTQIMWLADMIPVPEMTTVNMIEFHSKYVQGTGPQFRKFLENLMKKGPFGVVFLDEIAGLLDKACPDYDPWKEVVAEIMNKIPDVTFFFAVYECDLLRFYAGDPGFRRRVGLTVRIASPSIDRIAERALQVMAWSRPAYVLTTDVAGLTRIIKKNVPSELIYEFHNLGIAKMLKHHVQMEYSHTFPQSTMFLQMSNEQRVVDSKTLEKAVKSMAKAMRAQV